MDNLDDFINKIATGGDTSKNDVNIKNVAGNVSPEQIVTEGSLPWSYELSSSNKKERP